MKRLFQLLIALGTVLWLGTATGSGARVIINLSEQRAYLSFTSSQAGLVHSCGESFSVSSRPPIVNQRNEILPL